MMEIMGQEDTPRLFHQRYKGRVTEKEGKAFIGLTPEKVLEEG